MRSLLLLLALSILSASIKVPLLENKFRCMLLYSMGEDETMKIDINFPKVTPWDEKEDHYFVTLRNTINNDYKEDQASYGVYRKEISINSKVIYEICFELITSHEIDGEIVVDYNADTHYVLDHQKINIPENLLKTHELANSYENTVRLHDLADKLIDLQVQRHEKEERFFQETGSTQYNMTLVSIIEILLIAAVSAYQFFSIKKYFTDNRSGASF